MQVGLQPLNAGNGRKAFFLTPRREERKDRNGRGGSVQIGPIGDRSYTSYRTYFLFVLSPDLAILIFAFFASLRENKVHLSILPHPPAGAGGYFASMSRKTWELSCRPPGRLRASQRSSNSAMIWTISLRRRPFSTSDFVW